MPYVKNLKETLDVQHKTEFYSKIWEDEVIKEVIKTFMKAALEDESMKKQKDKIIESLILIEHELKQAKMACSTPNSSKKNKKKQKKALQTQPTPNAQPQIKQGSAKKKEI